MIIPRHLMWGFSTYILSIIHDVCIIIPGRALVNNNLGRHLVSLKYRRWKTPHWHYLLVTLIWDLHVSWHEVHPPSVTIILNDECFSTPFSYLCNVSVCPCNWTEEYSVREDGQTVYLRYQTTQTPSLSNTMAPTTPLRTHLLSPVICDPAWTRPYSMLRLRLCLHLHYRHLRRRRNRHKHTAALQARPLKYLIRLLKPCYQNMQFC